MRWCTLRGRHGFRDLPSHTPECLAGRNAGLLKEATELFPDPFIHLGGDEVAPGCWNSDPDITAFMAAHGINSASELQAWFTKKVLPIVKKYGRRPVYWQEAFESNATKVGGRTSSSQWVAPCMLTLCRYVAVTRVTRMLSSTCGSIWTTCQRSRKRDKTPLSAMAHTWTGKTRRTARTGCSLTHGAMP